MNKCECDNCEYCFSYGGYRGKPRREFLCKHPNQEYIWDYFKEHNIQKMPSFIGYGEKYSPVPMNKTTPKWCPKKLEQK